MESVLLDCFILCYTILTGQIHDTVADSLGSRG